MDSLSPEMQAAQAEYRKTASKHPDALGGLLAQVIADEVAIVSRMQQKCVEFLSQPGLDLRDMEEARRALDMKTLALKQLKGLANLEYETRKMHMTERDPMHRLQYNSKPEWTAQDMKLSGSDLNREPLPHPAGSEEHGK